MSSDQDEEDRFLTVIFSLITENIPQKQPKRNPKEIISIVIIHHYCKGLSLLLIV